VLPIRKVPQLPIRGPSALLAEFQQFLSNASGHRLVEQFKAAYPYAAIADVKMLDLVLWQSRE
jgi:hypothetical protein